MAGIQTETFRYLLENVDSESPGDMSVAPGQTEATLFFIIDYARALVIFDQILGYTEFDDRVFNPGAAVPIVGGLKRRIPMSHPRYPYMYASAVEFQPISPEGKWKSDQIVWAQQFFSDFDPATSVQWKTFPYTGNYGKVRMKVTFRTRNYFVLTDKQLDDVKLTDAGIPRHYSFWKKRFRFNAAGVIETFPDLRFYDDYCEYLRYTTMDIEPDNDLVVQEKGNVYYKSDPAIPPQPAVRANNSNLGMANASVNFQNVTKNRVKIKWHEIPKYALQWPGFVQNVGMINYGPNFDDDAGNVDVWNYEFFNFAPGTLLFLGITSEPSRQGANIVPMSKSSQWKLISPNLLNNFVDITFNFIQFTQPEDQLYRPNLNTMLPNRSGKSYSQGWNFVPFGDKQFRYIESTANGGQPQVPPYWTTPFQLLFNPNPLTPLP